MIEQDYKVLSIKGPSESLYKEKGSKFLGFAFPIESENEVKTLLNKLKEQHPKAVHHCYAFRLGTTRHHYRANDDGEPSGSAGRPILGQIDSKQLTNTLVVVVRYYGGIKLGVSGLISAYKTCAQEALNSAVIDESWIRFGLKVTLDYVNLREFNYLIDKFECVVKERLMENNCTYILSVPLFFKDTLIGKIQTIASVDYEIIEL